jgi:hypothetical protein
MPVVLFYKYLSEFETGFKKNLGYFSKDQIESIHEKKPDAENL